MLFSKLTTPQLIFLIVVPIIVLLILFALFLVIFIPIRRKQKQKNFKYFYYKKIYKIAMDRDYYLINDFLFRIDNSYVARIDHILFGDKFKR